MNHANVNPFQSSVSDLVKSMTLDEIKSVDFLPRIYSSLGMKDDYQIYLTNQTNSFQGGALILSPDTKLSLQERLTLSKGLYKAALQTCMDIYSNDQIAYEDTKKTECGRIMQ